MIDVGDKPPTARTATAVGRIAMRPVTLERIQRGMMKKGDVLAAARLAAVMGAKRTAEFIPLCHPLPLDGVDVRITEERRPQTTSALLCVTVTVKTTAKTGVEMEALTAVCAALLTIYDMSKAIDRTMAIGGIGLTRKRGGRSGDVRRSPKRILKAIAW
ncbi:MAG: cyclic pyranopterin monophosphate synthase MoaC [Nitrospirae bacterium]|nr:cyclic pyranopterin monophosphate synthase MoaC [Nitrospirota bacterium]